MPKAIRSILMLTAAATFVACAAPSGTSRNAGTGNVLTNADLVATNEVDPYRAVQKLRPNWLRPRGQTSTTTTTVVTLFVDGALRGSANDLRTLRIFEIQEITFLSASEAGFRFGTLAGSGGTLVVRTRG